MPDFHDGTGSGAASYCVLDQWSDIRELGGGLWRDRRGYSVAGGTTITGEDRQRRDEEKGTSKQDDRPTWNKRLGILHYCGLVLAIRAGLGRSSRASAGSMRL